MILFGLSNFVCWNCRNKSLRRRRRLPLFFGLWYFCVSVPSLFKRFFFFELQDFGRFLSIFLRILWLCSQSKPTATFLFGYRHLWLFSRVDFFGLLRITLLLYFLPLLFFFGLIYIPFLFSYLIVGLLFWFIKFLFFFIKFIHQLFFFLLKLQLFLFNLPFQSLFHTFFRILLIFLLLLYSNSFITLYLPQLYCWRSSVFIINIVTIFWIQNIHSKTNIWWNSSFFSSGTITIAKAIAIIQISILIVASRRTWMIIIVPITSLL